MANYSAEDIEVLTGLDPVKKRPGMYTDTVRPNHLAQEIIDNSVDEALAGHAKKIESANTSSLLPAIILAVMVINSKNSGRVMVL